MNRIKCTALRFYPLRTHDPPPPPHYLLDGPPIQTVNSCMDPGVKVDVSLRLLLAPLRFCRQYESNDIGFDPVRSTSNFPLGACMGQGDPGDLRNILHLDHQECPNKT